MLLSRMAGSISEAGTAPVAEASARHSGVVRATHWVTFLCFIALLISGMEIVISHPRFYWGETGNIWTTPLFQLPIPASRAMVTTPYHFVLPDQNGWSRALHFEAAWVLVLTGLLYLTSGLASGRFKRDLFPAKRDRSWRVFASTLFEHLRLKRPRESDGGAYNVLQRLTYLFVIFGLFPLVIWTGLAMSPGFVSAVPATVTLLGGQQSARTIHFIVSISLLLFVIGHVLMVSITGFRRHMRAMIMGSADASTELQ